jgi:hypothetical protein
VPDIDVDTNEALPACQRYSAISVGILPVGLETSVLAKAAQGERDAQAGEILSTFPQRLLSDNHLSGPSSRAPQVVQLPSA